MLFTSFARQSRLSVILYEEVNFDWFAKKPRALRQSYTLRGYILLSIIIHFYYFYQNDLQSFALCAIYSVYIIKTRWDKQK